MQTILGSGGAIATELAKELYLRYSKNIRLVSRNPSKVNPTDELFSADLLNPAQTDAAIKGSQIAYLTVGLPNDTAIWVEQFPIIMRNVIEACKKHQVKLVFFDNTYMYGKKEGIVFEKTPFSPIGEKAKVRAQISNMLLHEMKNKKITALIARAPEFYGLSDTKSITNGLVFNRIKRDLNPQAFLTDTTLRTLIFTSDAARAVALLGNYPDAYNQTWHLPCDNNPLNYKDFIAMIGNKMGKKLECEVLSQSQIELLASNNKNMAEALELLPRYEVDFVFDSSKFKHQFPYFKLTTYEEGIISILKEMNKI